MAKRMSRAEAEALCNKWWGKRSKGNYPHAPENCRLLLVEMLVEEGLIEIHDPPTPQEELLAAAKALSSMFPDGCDGNYSFPLGLTHNWDLMEKFRAAIVRVEEEQS